MTDQIEFSSFFKLLNSIKEGDSEKISLLDEKINEFKNGIKSIIQPGGSLRDIDSIEFCNQNKMSMMFSGIRHFKH